MIEKKIFIYFLSIYLFIYLFIYLVSQFVVYLFFSLAVKISSILIVQGIKFFVKLTCHITPLNFQEFAKKYNKREGQGAARGLLSLSQC